MGRGTWTVRQAAGHRAASPAPRRWRRAVFSPPERWNGTRSSKPLRPTREQRASGDTPAHLVGRQAEVERAKGYVVENRGVEQLIVAVLEDDTSTLLGQAAAAGQSAGSRPSRAMRPRDAGSTPLRQKKSVVLPASCFGPTNPTPSPAANSSETPSSRGRPVRVGVESGQLTRTAISDMDNAIQASTHFAMRGTTGKTGPTPAAAAHPTSSAKTATSAAVVPNRINEVELPDEAATKRINACPDPLGTLEAAHQRGAPGDVADGAVTVAVGPVAVAAHSQRPPAGAPIRPPAQRYSGRSGRRGCTINPGTRRALQHALSVSSSGAATA